MMKTNNHMDKTIKIYKDVNVENTKLGKHVSIGDNSRIVNCNLGEHVRVDRRNYFQNTSIGKHTYTGCDTRIYNATLGKFCSISWHVTIGGGEHKIDRITTHDFLYNPNSNFNIFKTEDWHNRYEKKVEIGNDVWIGAGSVILRGVMIGDGAVVGANSVITKDIPPYAVVAGNPGRIIKFRFSDDIIDRIIKLNWWDLDDSVIINELESFRDGDIIQTLNKLEKLKK